jgi:hypothetical protein
MKGTCSIDGVPTTSNRRFTDCTPVSCGKCPRFKVKKPRCMVADLIVCPPWSAEIKKSLMPALREAWSRGYAARMKQGS